MRFHLSLLGFVLGAGVLGGFWVIASGFFPGAWMVILMGALLAAILLRVGASSGLVLAALFGPFGCWTLSVTPVRFLGWPLGITLVQAGALGLALAGLLCAAFWRREPSPPTPSPSEGRGGSEEVEGEPSPPTPSPSEGRGGSEGVEGEPSPPTPSPSEGRGGSEGFLVGAVLLACAIGYVSGDPGGASPFIAFFERVFGAAREQAELASYLTRKTIHFVWYGTLAWLFFRGSRSAGAAIAFALVVACFDEGRQALTTTTRTGQFDDVVLDLAGMLTFVGISAWRARSTLPAAGTRSSKGR